MTDKMHPAGHMLQAFHDGELDPTVAADVERHCDQCEACKEELVDLERTEQLLAGSSIPELPHSVWHQVRLGRDRDSRFRPALGIAACAAGIVLGVLLGPVRFTAEETGAELAWLETATVWNGGATSSLLAVYETCQE
jgi:anti-sigma factor RsiW